MSVFKTKGKQIPGFYRKEPGAGTAGTTEKSAYTSLPSNWKQHQPPHLQDACFLPKRKRQKRKDHHSLGQAHTFLEKEWKPLQLQRGHRPASWGQDVTCPHYDGTVTSVVFCHKPRTSSYIRQTLNGTHWETVTVQSRLRRTATCEVGRSWARLEKDVWGTEPVSVNEPKLLLWFGQKYYGNLRGWPQGKLSKGYRSPLYHLCNFPVNLKSLQSKKFTKNIIMKIKWISYKQYFIGSCFLSIHTIYVFRLENLIHSHLK